MTQIRGSGVRIFPFRIDTSKASSITSDGRIAIGKSILIPPIGYSFTDISEIESSERLRAKQSSDSKRVKELESALSGLIDLYVKNRGSSGEFLSCITPKHAADMTKAERKKSDVWSAWDRARKAIGEKVG